MYGTTSPTVPYDPHGYPLGSHWQDVTATAATETVVIYIRSSATNARPLGPEERELRKMAAHVAALRASRELSLDPHPDRRRPRPPGPAPRAVSCAFHWMSQRKRCPRMRPPIPGYDRA